MNIKFIFPASFVMFSFLLVPISKAAPCRVFITQISGVEEKFVYQIALKINEQAEALDDTKFKSKNFYAFCHSKDMVRFCGEVSRISDTQLLIKNYPYTQGDVADIFSGDPGNNKAVFLVISELEPFKEAISPSAFFSASNSKNLIPIIATPVQVGFLPTPKKNQTSD